MKENNIARIFLLGYIGIDKEKVAKDLASQLGWNYTDMEKEIVATQKMPLSEICMKYGEHQLRNHEAELLETLGNETKVVISCTDGIILDRPNCDILKGEYAVFLNGDLDSMFQNAKQMSTPPYAYFLMNDDVKAKETFVKQYIQRENLYREVSRMEINVDESSTKEIGSKIVETINENI